MGVNPMKDRYANFGQLAGSEKRGQDFRVRSRARAAVTVVVALHGGEIEPGTSEIAEAIAGANLSFYAFEGIKAKHNRRLHITSTNFNEPGCLDLVAVSKRVVTIHGKDSERPIVILGGRDKGTAQRLRKSLQHAGVPVKTNTIRLHSL